jgi:hypothetical protein
MNQESLLAHVAECLDAAGIPYMVAGSHASSFHGQPRATHDVDLVIDPTQAQLDRFLDLLGERYYVRREAAREALGQRSMFNLIDLTSGWKADLIVRKDRPYSLEEFRRREMRIVHGSPRPIASAEDVILTKLEWDRIMPSERQVQDALHVAVVQGSRLDLGYLRQWAAPLGVTARLEEVLRKAAELGQGEQARTETP